MKEYLLQLLGDDQIDACLEYYLQSAAPIHQRNEAVLLKGRLEQVERANRLGTLSYDQHSRERNQVRLAVQELCMKLVDPGEVPPFRQNAAAPAAVPAAGAVFQNTGFVVTGGSASLSGENVAGRDLTINIHKS